MTLPDHIKNKHFLICDDYESMRTMVTDSLKSLGVTKISAAKSGNEGYKFILQNLTTNPVEFVVTDLMMKDGSGIDLAKSIRADQKAWHLPILMVTSMSDISYVLESVKAGINNYVVKPWEIEDLSKRIVEAYDKNLKIKR